MWGLEGRPVLVTGASGGIGGATVRQLVAAGADVIASGRAEGKLAELASKTGCRTLAFDLTSEDSVRGALGKLDLWGVVNCGGFGGEIAALVAERALLSLLAPVARVTGYDTIVPLPRLEQQYMPSVARIVAAGRGAVQFG